jgi:hypothetical protein
MPVGPIPGIGLTTIDTRVVVVKLDAHPLTPPDGEATRALHLLWRSQLRMSRHLREQRERRWQWVVPANDQEARVPNPPQDPMARRVECGSALRHHDE